MKDMEDSTDPADMEGRSFLDLVLTALLLGGFGAVAALVFLGVTGVGARWYGQTGFGWFDGKLWWVAVAAAAGLIVGLMRKAFNLPARNAGLAEEVQTGSVEVKMVPKVVAVSAVSLIGGASLGPEAALSQIGGGAGSYMAERRGLDESSKRLNTRTGIAGTFGGLFSSTLMATILVF